MCILEAKVVCCKGRAQRADRLGAEGGDDGTEGGDLVCSVELDDNEARAWAEVLMP